MALTNPSSSATPPKPASSTGSTPRGPHYGWWILVSGWVVYGFGISPAYYSWGQLLPHAIDELGLDRARAGLGFGLFTLLYSTVAPLSGILIQRFGVRAVMTLGGVIASCGFLLMSRATDLWTALLGFSILGGLGIGLGVLLPTQTLANNWFVRYRATALAILMTAGGIVGKAVPRFSEWMVANSSWRDAWLVVAGCSLAVALIALVFVRNTPESVGLQPDCRFSPPGGPDQTKTARALDPDWDPSVALRTREFAALVFCGIAFATPWGIAVAHGPLHLRDLHFGSLAAASIMGWMILTSIAGRLLGLVGDWLAPQRALALALALEALGLAGFFYAPTPRFALISAIALGLGFGTAYVSVSATLSAFFGRRAFSLTAGIRMMFTGVINAAMPVVAGWAFDRSGSYGVPFLAVAVLAAAGACLAWILQPPRKPSIEPAPP